MKCHNCGSKVVEYPIKDVQGKLIWKNFLIGNPYYTWFAISVLVIIFGVNQFMVDCNYIKEEPDEFCGQYCNFRDSVAQPESPLYLQENFTFDINIKDS